MGNKLQVLTVANVRGYEKDGTVYLNVEDVARGLGFTQEKNSIDYVRWETVRDYLRQFNFSQLVGKDTFIPENIFYRLAMKTKNEVAEKFQILVADEILPAIRKTGMYITPATKEKLLDDPTSLKKILENWERDREEKNRLAEVVEVQNLQIAEMEPKASYYDLILQSKEAIPVSLIAKDYGMSGKAMNQLLHDLKIQYPLSGTWLVYQNYAAKGYTCTKTYQLENGYSKTHTYWTQKGRLFLYELLKQHGHLPLIEQVDA